MQVKKRLTIHEAQERRARNIEYYRSVDCFQTPTAGVDSGAWGKRRELESHKDTSIKADVTKPNFADGYFRLDGKAKTLEYKTNGGRVGSIINALANGRNGFVVYEMRLQNAATSRKMRRILPVIMTYEYFINLLTETGALRLNSRDGEPCIQSSSKGLYNALLDYPIPFERDLEYVSSDFEDLE